MDLAAFVRTGIGAVLSGGTRYRLWIALLGVIMATGVACYLRQLTTGLVVTGMSDQVSWGFYISNFAFLVGIAAAAVLLVIPAYLYHREDIKAAVILGEALAVAAVLAAMTFVIVDLGRPDRILHLVPIIGRFNWPTSMLAWDVVVLSGYLALNVAIPGYVLWCLHRGRSPSSRAYFPFVVLAMFWAISIHTVTAFLFAANSARPFWNVALLAPRFIATAFASGPALIILVLQAVRRHAGVAVAPSVISTLSLIMATALQISLFFTGCELFTDFYNEGGHAASMRYLYFGLHGLTALRPYIWTALAMNLIAVCILSIHPLRRRPTYLNVACVLVFLGIWIEKGMGLVVPGYIPTPLGEVFEYTPTRIEFGIAAGVWAFGALVFTLAAKASIAIQGAAAARRQATPSVTATA